MFRTVLTAIAALGLTAAAATAQAGTLSYDGYTVLNNQNVTLTDKKVTTDPQLMNGEQGGSGQITLLKIDGTTSSLSTWCIDVQDWLQNSGQFTTGGYLTGLFGYQVNALLTHVLPLLGGDPLVSSALQIAIWTEEYGSDLTIVTGNSALDTLASTYVSNVNSGNWGADGTKSVATLIGVNGNQDQAYLVPEPGTLAVLGAGLLGLAAFGAARRRSAPRALT